MSLRPRVKTTVTDFFPDEDDTVPPQKPNARDSLALTRKKQQQHDPPPPLSLLARSSGSGSGGGGSGSSSSSKSDSVQRAVAGRNEGSMSLSGDRKASDFGDHFVSQTELAAEGHASGRSTGSAASTTTSPPTPTVVVPTIVTTDLRAARGAESDEDSVPVVSKVGKFHETVQSFARTGAQQPPPQPSNIPAGEDDMDGLEDRPGTLSVGPLDPVSPP